MLEHFSIDFNVPVPVFPLASCVLLPHATVPLHIFEPRYREMTRDVLEGNKLIAMAMFAGDGWKQDYRGNPPIREHVCLGSIVRHEKFPDGRYHILLQGICRAKVDREIEHEPYRLALLDPVDGDPPLEIDFEHDRQRITDMLEDPFVRRLAAVESLQNWISKEVPTNAVVDLAVMSLCRDDDARYAILAEPDLRARVDWLEHYLDQTRITLQLADKLGNGQTEEGYNLN
jgi:hypothetical protein